MLEYLALTLSHHNTLLHSDSLSTLFSTLLDIAFLQSIILS